VAERHDHAVLGAGGHLRDAGRLAGSTTSECTGRGEGVGHAGEESGAVVMNLAQLAVHDRRRAHHAATVCLADGLVPEAHPRMGMPAPGCGSAPRDPRSAGVLGPWRDHHRRRPALADVGHRGGVIAHHHAARPQLAQPLDQIEGERIVVVDKPRLNLRDPARAEGISSFTAGVPSLRLTVGRTASTARTRARSLLSISRASSAGSESGDDPRQPPGGGARPRTPPRCGARSPCPGCPEVQVAHRPA